MKKLLFPILLLTSLNVYSQVGINTSAPDQSAVLDIKSSNKGLLIPRVALTGKTDITTIPNPTHSLMIYNLNDAGVSPNNVTADNLYKFNSKIGKWEKLLDENTPIPGAVGMSNIFGFKKTGNDTSFLGTDLGASIRKINYDNIITTSGYATYNTATGELTILKSGFFTFNINFVIKGAMTGTPRVGVSKPYTGTFAYNGNASFAFLSQPYVTVDASTPVTLFSSGTLNLVAGQKVIFLTRFIDPTVNTLDVENINYDRTMVNSVVISYTAP
ncbi:hypothetical protein [Chryseobacterium sp. IT-36CA2]|uniref:hypothetical protein n=1 Tax=Chryseobacterium sp. IT-36CA2 TaxID=3026460 RepID=UPI0039E0DED0